jgi:serine/threonine protein phosphatase PrpC
MTVDPAASTIRCPQCSETNPVSARFCRACGAALASQEPVIVTPTQPLAPPDTNRLPRGEIVSGPDGADLYIITDSPDTPSPHTYGADSLLSGARVRLHEATSENELTGLRAYYDSDLHIPYVADTEPSFTVAWFGSERYYAPEVIPEGNTESSSTIDEWIEIARQLVQALAALHETAGVAFNLTAESCPQHISIRHDVAYWHSLGDLVLLHETPDAAINDMRILAAYLRRPLSTAPTLRTYLEGAAEGHISTAELSRLLGAPKRSSAVDASVKHLRMDIGAATDKGMQREANEDNYGVATQGDTDRITQLLIVADGMGGEEAGEVASELTVKRLTEAFMQNKQWSASQINTWLQRTIRETNDIVLQEARQRRNQMGATLVVAIINSNMVYLANVGDSRIYRWNPERDRGQMTRLTRDHSLVQRLVDMGQITDEQRYSHPDRNMVLRSIGDARMGYADIIKPVDLHSGDWLLLCSDGLWEMVRDNRIRELLSKATSAQDACDKLIVEANMNGGEDNITAVAVRFSHI